VRVMLGLVAVFLLAGVQARGYVDCQSLTDVDSCVAVNDEFHPKRHSAHIKCLWCHSHDDSGADTHCQSLTAIRANPDTYQNWVCDHMYPSDTPKKHFQSAHSSKRSKKVKPHSTPAGKRLRAHPLDLPEDPYGSSSSGKNSMMKGSSKSPSSSKKDTSKNGKDSTMKKSTDPNSMKKMTNPGIMPNQYTAYSGTVQQFVKDAPKPVQFLGGLAMGVLGSIPFSPTKAIADVDSVANDIKSIVQNFSLKPSGYLKDVVMIADTVKDAYSTLKDSGALEVAEDAAKVAAKADNPIGWLVGAGELALNGANIYYDIQTAISAAKSGDEFTLGKSIGSILALLAE